MTSLVLVGNAFEQGPRAKLKMSWQGALCAVGEIAHDREVPECKHKSDSQLKYRGIALGA